MYAFNLLKDKKEIDYKKLKGVKKTTVKQEVSFKDYFKSLMGEIKEDIQKSSTFNCIRSMNHQLHSLQVTKIGLNASDDKRFLLDHINTLAHGHYKIKTIV